MAEKINVGPSMDENGEQEQEDHAIKYSKHPDEDAFLSDWKIEVHSTDDDGHVNGDDSLQQSSSNTPVAVYSVHRYVMASQCQYFRRLLSSGQFADSLSNVFKTHLPMVAVSYFDSFLDLIYDTTPSVLLGLKIDKVVRGGNQDPFTTKNLFSEDNVVPIMHLADYFQVFWLQRTARHFIQNWLDVSEIQGQNKLDVVAARAVKIYKQSNALGVWHLLSDEVANSCVMHPAMMTAENKFFCTIPDVWNALPGIIKSLNSIDRVPRQWDGYTLDLFEERPRPIFATRGLFLTLERLLWRYCFADTSKRAYIAASKRVWNIIELFRREGEKSHEKEFDDNIANHHEEDYEAELSTLEKKISKGVVAELLPSVHYCTYMEQFMAQFSNAPPLAWLELLNEWMNGPKSYDDGVVCLELKGAGSPEVDGIYYWAGQNPDSHWDFYQKRGKYGSKDAIFTVYRVGDWGDGEGRIDHYIGVNFLPDEEDEIDIEDDDFLYIHLSGYYTGFVLYMAPRHLSEEEGRVRVDWTEDIGEGWRTVNGMDPPPAIDAYKNSGRHRVDPYCCQPDQFYT